MPASPTPLPFDSDEVKEAFPDYSIQAPELGRGSFKVAYLANTPQGERVVKILTDPVDRDPDVEGTSVADLPERLARELEGMAQVESDFVVKVLSPPKVVEIGTNLHIAYEEPYYPGGTLADRLESGPLESSEVDQLVLCLLCAVQDLWSQQGIVHRDIKPGNIVFDHNDRPVLLDLGIALYTALSGLTDSWRESPRTTIYAAPEQFEIRRYAEIDFRTDLFQIGIVGFEAVSGRHPFLQPGVKDVDSYVSSLFKEMPVDLSSLPCSDEMRIVLGRLLAHRPNRRYRTIEEPIKILRGEK